MNKLFEWRVTRSKDHLPSWIVDENWCGASMTIRVRTHKWKPCLMVLAYLENIWYNIMIWVYNNNNQYVTN